MAEWASVVVGRREELATLAHLLGEVERGEARAIGLRGEPGIGKSRLLGELATDARGRGLLVLAGRAAELERDLPFALLMDALESVEGAEVERAVRELDPGHQGELAAVLPGIGSLLGGKAAPTSGERHRVARAVRALLEQLADARPVALLLDDVHWADPASTDVVGLLLHRPPRHQVLLGVALRSGRAPELEGALAAAQQNGTGDVIELGALPEAVVAELVPSPGRRRASMCTRERRQPVLPPGAGASRARRQR